MKISLADSIAITLNVPVNKLIDGQTILGIFQSGELPQEWEYHIGSIFLEFEVKNINSFIEVYNIPIQNMKKIYEKTPKFYHTKRMDEFLYGTMGRIA